MRRNRPPSILPICAQFDLAKYEGKKPTPNENTFVSVDGRLDGVNLDSSKIAILFSLVVDNISFLGKGPTPTLSAGTTSMSYSLSSLLFFYPSS